MINLLFVFSVSYIFSNHIVKNYLTGIDERIHFYPYKDNKTTIYNVLKIIENTEKINFLQLNNVSIDDKLFEIDQNVPKKICILNGGLFHDWNFDIDQE
jgi:hypothetical protein